MTKAVIAGLGLSVMVLGLCACGNPEFDRGFNDKWSKTTHDTCVSSASSHNAPADLVERYCTCVVAKLMPLPVSEKMSLNGSSPKLQEAANACLAQLQPGGAGASNAAAPNVAVPTPEPAAPSAEPATPPSETIPDKPQ